MNHIPRALLVLAALALAPSRRQVAGESRPHQFATPSGAVNITHVTYDPLHDTVYLGATNSLYQLSGADLSEQFEQSTGPVFDNPLCGISECHGFEELMKPTQNTNKLLVIDYQHQKLLSCGSTKQGACRRHQLGNITQREPLVPIPVAANDDNSSTYAFVGPARYPAEEPARRQQQVLYVASTYTKSSQSRDLLVPAIGTRVLDDGPNLLKLYERSLNDGAAYISSHLRDYFLVNYLFGFASANHVYFVTVQRKATSRDSEELGYHTRLARICITDSSYNSYTELDLKCLPGKRRHPRHPPPPAAEYPLLQDAALVDAGARLLKSLGLEPPATPDEAKVLVGVFSSARDHTWHAGDHSAVCAFPLAQIEERFSANVHNCYTGRMQSRNMEYIAGNLQECPRAGQAGNQVNFCHETLKINGTLPVEAEAAIEFQNSTLTAVAATSHVEANAQGNIYAEQLQAEAASLAAATNATQPPRASAANQRQHTVVFAGTAAGRIKKILLDDAAQAVEFEDTLVDAGAPILADLHLHASGQQLIVATPHKVVKVATHNCAQYASCRECSQSRNPYCGWCALERSCTSRHECTGAESAAPKPSGQQLKWISNESAGAAKCIDLQAVVPDRMPITSMGKVELHIERLPRLPRGHSYKCIFDRREQTPATPTQLGLSCPLPKVMDRPKIQPGRDHVSVDLAVRSSETNTDFLNGKVTFFECQLHTTCKDCLSASWGCNWCLNENICLFNTSKCEKSPAPSQRQVPAASTSSGASLSLAATQSARAANTIGQVSQCPTFDVGHKQEILVADGGEQALAIRVRNMPQFKGNIQCVVEVENDKTQLKARIEEGRVICENSTFSYAADVGLLTGQLVVVYSDNNIVIDRTNFTLYKCHLLGAYLNRPDCSLCQRVDSRFDCAWCSGACQHRSRCAEPAQSKCPSPRIDFVSPTSGPTLGGTRVTIEGSNLGKSFAEIASRVSIANVPCRPIEEEYRPSNKIVCVTGPVVARSLGASGKRLGLFGDTGYVQDSSDSLVLGDVMVGNEVGYSMGPTKFQFKSVYLRDHQPRFGPQSGGTRLTLFGMNLNIGSGVQVFLDELPCVVEPSSVTAEQLVCRTSASRQGSRAIKQLKLIVDDAQIIRDDDVYYYTQDPTISRISPLRSYLSGGRPINVYGTNLTTVQQPRMSILDAMGKRVNESTCIVHDDYRMQCPSPAVNLQMMDLEWSEQQVGAYEPQPFSSSTWMPIGGAGGQNPKLLSGETLQHDESVKFKISFIMDNVWHLRDLQTSSPQLSSEIAYTSDPKLYSFASPQYKAAQETFLAGVLTGDQQQQQSAYNQYQIDSDTYLLQPGEPMLILHGEHLGAAVSEYEITVTVGYDLCNLTQLTHTRLVCLLPLDHMAEPTDEERHPTQRALPLVVVRIGFNLRYELGYVQYHPQLVEQIVQASANSSDRLMPYPRLPNYVPSENKSLLQRISSYIVTTLLLLVYLTLGTVLVAFAYSGLCIGYKLYQKSPRDGDHRQVQNKVSLLEKSVRTECRLAALALRSDLNELVRHVELSGTPLLNMKSFIMKVFFPGINNHPLLAKPKQPEQAKMRGASEVNLLMQQPSSVPHPLKTNAELPMEHFERLVLTKPFLVAFINTLEEQPSFTIRDKVNVASLIMIILVERLDYATDILRTLLFQLVQRCTSTATVDHTEHPAKNRRFRKSATLNFSRKASNLLGGLPIAKRGSRGSNLSKIVDGGASGLMASTQVAAHVLLSRVGTGTKTSPLQQESEYMLNSSTLAPNLCTTTTTFNQRAGHQNSSTLGRPRSGSSEKRSGSFKSDSQSHLMLRRTDSVVEKMLTNWLAMNMYDYFYGDAGQSLYMMFEALRGQIERGPVDAISGDSFYSLNEHRLLREAHIQFELVNLYVVVDADILQSSGASGISANNLLLDSPSTMPPVYSMDSQSFYEDTMQVRSHNNTSQYSISNTITLALRVLDCDTISQIKGKILAALYRNSPHSGRLGVSDVELSLRQPRHMQQSATTSGANQFMALTLSDDDYSSLTAFNGMRRINTLRHYGITDQAIMMLKKCRTSATDQPRAGHTVTRTTLTDMLDEHYNNPYSEIQYGPITRLDGNETHPQQAQHTHTRSQSKNNGRSWHLTRQDEVGHIQPVDSLSDNSSPMSNSPSMMLLGNENVSQINPSGRPRPSQAQQQYYHPSSSSTSSGGNVMETNSTSANSSSMMNVTNLLAKGVRQEQPIYCQIGSVSAGNIQGATGSGYYCQIGANNHDFACGQTMRSQATHRAQVRLDREQENQIYLSRMLTTKGTIQNYIDDFFKTILSAKSSNEPCDEMGYNQVLCGDPSQRVGASLKAGACPPAVKWLFDLLDEAAMESGIDDESVIHSWKSNAFLLRFWMNLIKNPNYILDVEKSNTLDASLSAIAQVLMDSCNSGGQKLSKESTCNKMLFVNDVPKYKGLVKRFYQDVASMRPVSDQEIIKQMGSLSAAMAGKFDTNLALKELCVYAVNYGVELMNALNTDYSCQQLNLSQQLEQCFRSFTLFEAYR